jgi:hypothetical protein
VRTLKGKELTHQRLDPTGPTAAAPPTILRADFKHPNIGFESTIIRFVNRRDAVILIPSQSHPRHPALHVEIEDDEGIGIFLLVHGRGHRYKYMVTSSTLDGGPVR